MTVQCPRCGSKATVVQTKYGPKHECCGLWSWHGKPLADKATHDARKAAHAAFDTLWKQGTYTRAGAYKALAAALGLGADECHISRMSEAEALRVVALVPELAAKVPKRLKARRSNFAGINPW